MHADPSSNVLHWASAVRRKQIAVPMHLPQKAQIEEIGLGGIDEIENHRVSGTLFVQYRLNVHDAKGKVVDCVVKRFDLPVCVYNSEKHPDLRELTLTELETLFLTEAQRVISELPSPLRRIELNGNP